MDCWNTIVGSLSLPGKSQIFTVDCQRRMPVSTANRVLIKVVFNRTSNPISRCTNKFLFSAFWVAAFLVCWMLKISALSAWKKQLIPSINGYSQISSYKTNLFLNFGTGSKVHLIFHPWIMNNSMYCMCPRKTSQQELILDVDCDLDESNAPETMGWLLPSVLRRWSSSWVFRVRIRPRIIPPTPYLSDLL